MPNYGNPNYMNLYRKQSKMHKEYSTKGNHNNFGNHMQAKEGSHMVEYKKMMSGANTSRILIGPIWES